MSGIAFYQDDVGVEQLAVEQWRKWHLDLTQENAVQLGVILRICRWENDYRSPFLLALQQIDRLLNLLADSLDAPWRDRSRRRRKSWLENRKA